MVFVLSWDRHVSPGDNKRAFLLICQVISHDAELFCLLASISQERASSPLYASIFLAGRLNENLWISDCIARAKMALHLSGIKVV